MLHSSRPYGACGPPRHPVPRISMAVPSPLVKVQLLHGSTTDVSRGCNRQIVETGQEPRPICTSEMLCVSGKNEGSKKSAIFSGVYKWARMGSNHQPTPYEGAALPLSYGPKERATGFGPAMSAWKADALPLGDARKKNRSNGEREYTLRRPGPSSKMQSASSSLPRGRRQTGDCCHARANSACPRRSRGRASMISKYSS